jgi:hypothetical protein
MSWYIKVYLTKYLGTYFAKIIVIILKVQYAGKCYYLYFSKAFQKKNSKVVTMDNVLSSEMSKRTIFVTILYKKVKIPHLRSLRSSLNTLTLFQTWAIVEHSTDAQESSLHYATFITNNFKSCGFFFIKE